MDIVLISHLLDPAFFAMIGGLFGSATMGVDIDRYGARISIALIISAGIISGAVGDYLSVTRGVTSLWVNTALSIPVGMFSGSLMDVIRVSSPRLAQTVVDIAEKRVLR